MIRHLVFHLFPLKQSVWTWHLARLLEKKHFWNGRRIVVVALGAGTEDEAVIRKRLDPLEAEIVICRNSAYYGEAAHFIETLRLLQSPSSAEAVFYAHAKGVTRDDKNGAIHRWCSAMYRLNLMQPSIVDHTLSTHEAMGAFRVDSPMHGAPWHYSGTFWWARLDAIFTRNWTSIAMERFGVEGYLGRLIPLERSVNLTPPGISATALYEGYVTPERIRSWELDAFVEWGL